MAAKDPVCGMTVEEADAAATSEYKGTTYAGYTWLAVLAVVNSVVSLAYYLRVLTPAYFERVDAPLPVLAQSAATVTVACAALVVIAGVGAGPVLDWFGRVRLLPG